MPQGEIAEADGGKTGETSVNRGMFCEERQGIRDAACEQVSDGKTLPLDGEHLGFEAARLADGTRHEDVGKKLHLDAFVPESETVIAPAITAVEGEACWTETGGLRGGGLRIEFPNELPRLGVDRRIGAGRAGKG